MVGEKGNEGKTFCQDKIEEQYGRHRVCAMSLTESSKNLLHYLRGCVNITTDIIMIGNPRGSASPFLSNPHDRFKSWLSLGSVGVQK